MGGRVGVAVGVGFCGTEFGTFEARSSRPGLNIGSVAEKSAFDGSVAGDCVPGLLFSAGLFGSSAADDPTPEAAGFSVGGPAP